MLEIPLLLVHCLVGSSSFLLRFLCSRQSILWRSRLRAVPVLVFLLYGHTYCTTRWLGTSCCVSSLSSGPKCSASWLVWTRRLSLLVLTFFPSRGAPLGVSGPRCPSSWPAWTTGQCEGSQVQFLDKVFLLARCCPTFVLIQTVFYTVAFPQLQFITVVEDAFTLCPFHCRQARVARRHARLGPFLVVQFLDKLFSPVVVLRQVPILSKIC